MDTDFAMRDEENNVKALYRQGQVCINQVIRISITRRIGALLVCDLSWSAHMCASFFSPFDGLAHMHPVSFLLFKFFLLCDVAMLENSSVNG